MSKLKREIGPFVLFFLVVNIIAGTDIFFIPAIGARYAGSASLISWAIVGTVSIFISMIFAELISLYPNAGGAYEYTKEAFGGFWGFTVGWMSWMILNIVISMLIVGALYYLLPHASMLVYGVISISIILILNYVTYRGIKWSSKMLLIFGFATILALLTVAIPSAFQMKFSNFLPFELDISKIMMATFFIYEIFFGWESATYLSEEVKNPRYVFPKVIVWATIFTVVMSIAFVFVTMGVMPISKFAASDTPILLIVQRIFPKSLQFLFSIIIFSTLIGTVAGNITTSPRLLYAMARDKTMITQFSKIHKKYGTPYNAILFQTISAIVITIIGFANYKYLLEILLPLEITLYTFVIVAFIKLRTTNKSKRTFTFHFGRPIAWFIIFFNILIMFYWCRHSSNSLSILMTDADFVFIGIPFYLIIKLYSDKKFVGKFFDDFSWVWDKFFPIWYGEEEKMKVIKNAGVRPGSTVLDFGAGSGLTTLELSLIVGKRGRVVATDLSKNQLARISKKIFRKKTLSNVILLHEDGEITKFPENSFNSIVSVSTLSHTEDPVGQIKNLLKYLKHGGKFSFLAFGKSFFFPCEPYLKNEETVRNLFKKAGYNVHIEGQHKRFTHYWFIWGEKP